MMNDNQNQDMYYEIEYDSSPFPGAGKFVLKPQRVEEPELDEIRELFYRMRALAREHPSSYDMKRFFDRRVYYDNSVSFYKQAEFMKDFTDDYSENVSFAQYFPYYQLMNYEQLRTYFTWRTKVRKGDINDTSLSYAYLYLYELLENVGVDSPEEGLEKILSFWETFREYTKALDKYVIQWFKDYHVYYEFPWTFAEFVKEHQLYEHYPEFALDKDRFTLYCGISKYDLRKSAFYLDGNEKLIRNCFDFTFERLKSSFSMEGLSLEASIFQPSKTLLPWAPFRSALFYQWKTQRDRQVILSENEIYFCRNSQWTSSPVLTNDGGKQFLAYLMKQMESVLRRLTKYKHKLPVPVNATNQATLSHLSKQGVSVEKVVEAAVTDFYREATKTVVRVDPVSLSAIRQDALVTQEKLLVPEENPVDTSLGNTAKTLRTVLSPDSLNTDKSDMEADRTGAWKPDVPGSLKTDESDSLKVSCIDTEDNINGADAMKSHSMYTDTELGALSVILSNHTAIKKYADEHGMMLEVLIDGINEKAMDDIGDNLIDDEYQLYKDYTDYVNRILSGIV